MSLRLSGGRKLLSPPGSATRPTAARVRLAVMNLLAPHLRGCRWLDLCCGSGVMACEALQRGARSVVAVDRNRHICAIARANLEAVALGLRRKEGDGSGEEMQGEVLTAVHNAEACQWLRSQPSSPCDVIYLDPPYGAGLLQEITRAAGEHGWLASGGILLWECGCDQVPAVPEGWKEEQRRRYGGTTLVLLSQTNGRDRA